jgi:hypothetical protein
MIRVNMLHTKLVPKPERAFARLVHFIAAIPTEKPKSTTRIERREMRTVICGSCGKGENWVDLCQWCGGPAETAAIQAPQAVRLRRQLKIGHEIVKRTLRANK